MRLDPACLFGCSGRPTPTMRVGRYLLRRANPMAPALGTGGLHAERAMILVSPFLVSRKVKAASPGRRYMSRQRRPSTSIGRANGEAEAACQRRHSPAGSRNCERPLPPTLR